LKTAYRGWYVDIGPVVGPSDKIWTISLNEESNQTPILLLHGVGAGVALWCKNLDSLSVNRPVYAIDILGFGKSSRPSFSSDAAEAEKELVTSVEEWRKEMQLKKFILLGHSFGGFLATSYALHFPERVTHLILADPWGFPEKPADIAQKYNIPLWVRALAFATQPLNPLWAVRLAGPLGQWVIEKFRPDLIEKFTSVLNENVNIIPQYVYHCNAQTPSGESAFHAMMTGFGWAKRPMCNRIDSLNKEIPVTLLYGSRSWVDNLSGEVIKQKRTESYVNIQVIQGAGHHVYADKSDIFNRHVNEACKLSDSEELTNKSQKLSKPYSPAEIEDEISNTESDENLPTSEEIRQPAAQNPTS
ncbi:hypothetical protein L9F63_007141, partial [Diploptera punctata]